jgi:L-lactate dehydrogenase complex protein LldG
MQDYTSREYILKKIRQALVHKKGLRFPAADWDKNIYATGNDLPEEQFAKAFTKVGGHFIFCENEDELVHNLRRLAHEEKWEHVFCREEALSNLLKKSGINFQAEPSEYPEEMTGITGCEALIARLGSVLVSSGQGSGRRLFVAPTVHVIIAYTSQVVPEMKDGLERIRKKYGYRMPSFIASLTGPSRTADIEKTLVTPAHGPRDIFVFLVEG